MQNAPTRESFKAFHGHLLRRRVKKQHVGVFHTVAQGFAPSSERVTVNEDRRDAAFIHYKIKHCSNMSSFMNFRAFFLLALLLSTKFVCLSVQKRFFKLGRSEARVFAIFDARKSLKERQMNVNMIKKL